MIRAGAGQSSDSSTERAVNVAFSEAFRRAGISKADLALVFFTAEHAVEQQRFADLLRTAMGSGSIVGSSAHGVLTGDGEVEGSHGLAVLVIASDDIRGDPFIFQSLKTRDAPAAREIANAARSSLKTGLLTILLPDSYNAQPQQLLQTLEETLGHTPIVGAGSSESGMTGATFQLCNEKITNNAVCGLHLSGKYDCFIDITQGCQPIAGTMTITRAERNLIYQIDGRPAFEVFSSVLKGPLRDDLRQALMHVFIGLPADRERNQLGAGEYLVRNIIGLDSSKGIVAVAEPVREGQSLVFTLRDGQRARDDLTQMLERQAQRLRGKKPAFGVYFNCCARGASLYGIPGIDSAYIRQTLGQFPLIGMFGGYELAPLGGANHLFAYTGVLALIIKQD